MGLDILYHVRGGAPAKGARTLRFRNTFMGFTCLIASADKQHAVRDWFNRYIACTFPFIQEMRWNEQGQLIGVLINDMSNESLWSINKQQFLDTKLYIYKFNLDSSWNKHPFKNCYMTRSNVKYLNDVECNTLNSFIDETNFTIEYTE